MFLAKDLAQIQAINAASLKAYGGGVIKLDQDTDGRRCFTLETSNFRLTDEFDGGNPFCGIVRVTRKADNATVWNNYYHGWLTEEATKHNLSPETVFNFMREALQHADLVTASRGPKLYKNKTFRYVNRPEVSEISCFYGQEAIYYRGHKDPVYICRYGGGLVNLSADMGEAQESQEF